MTSSDYSDKGEAYFSRARKDIAPLLPAHPGRVLEIGCGSGATLQWLQRECGAGQTVGVEIEPAAAKRASACVDRVLVLDVERDGLPADLGRFDLVLCLDVLEHLRDPWRVLAMLTERHLHPQGTMIISVPNVRHAGVVLPLLFQGRWRYTDSGILDRTHLRFFTRESAVQLVTGAGLQLGRIIDTPLEGSRSGGLDRLTLGLFRPFLTVQFLLAGSPGATGREPPHAARHDGRRP